jgi:ribosome-associated protein
MNFGERKTRMVKHHSHQQTRILVQAAAAACEDKKAEDTRILELDAADSGLSDFFLVTSATNDRQAVAIADEIEMRLKRNFGVMPNSVEGRRKGDWILLDYVDFVVHVFLAERRAFYDIERLRKSARPLSPAEFETELKHALADKTREARSKPAAPAKKAAKSGSKAASKSTARASKTIATAKKKAAAKAAPAKKSAAKSVAKKAAKGPAKKVAAKKTAARPGRSR